MWHYPEADPAHWVVSVRDDLEWRRPKECSQSPWLEQVDRSCQEALRMGRGLAWRRPEESPGLVS